MRLLAGAGPRGLAGIAPSRGLYVRPLIESRRGEIVAHLRGRGLPWVEDASNLDPAFLRNRIRHDVLPFLAARLDPDIVASLGRGSAVARALVSDLERRASAELARAARPGAGGLVMAVEALARLPVDLAAEVLRQAALRADPRLVALRAPGERALRRLLDPGAPRRPVRLARVTIERSGRWLRVGAGAPAAIEPRRFAVPGRLDLDELGLVLDARAVPASPAYRFSLDRGTVAFDADRLPACLTVRGRRRGDRFTPFGGPGLRRLKSFLIDADVPRWERDRVPLLEADGEIVWVVGLRRGASAPVSGDTRRILEVTVRGPLAVSPPAE
jgi:tRNA(Ile)-lysidine synthase